jgi:hypothetical protein
LAINKEIYFMTNHNFASAPYEPSETFQRGYEYIRNHPKRFALGATALVLFGVANSTAAEDGKKYDCVAGSEKVIAEPGDTLTSIAEEFSPDMSPEIGVFNLKAINPAFANPNHILQAGETLSIPVCGDDIPKH